LATQTSAGGLTLVEWSPYDDPDEADGEDGTGVSNYVYRYEQANGAWTDWTTTVYPGFPIAGFALGATIHFEVRATDNVGNTSTTSDLTATVATGSDNSDCEPHDRGAYPASCVDDSADVTDGDTSTDEEEDMSLVQVAERDTAHAASQFGFGGDLFRITVGIKGPDKSLQQSSGIPMTQRWATYRDPPGAWALGNVHNGWMLRSDGDEKVLSSCCSDGVHQVWRRGVIYTGGLAALKAGDVVSGPQGGCGWVIAFNTSRIPTSTDETSDCFGFAMHIGQFALWTNCSDNQGIVDRSPCNGGTRTDLQTPAEMYANVDLTPDGNTSTSGVHALGLLPATWCVEWRYITKDGRWAMVKVRSRPNGSASWVFIKASALVQPASLLPDVNTYPKGGTCAKSAGLVSGS
jgi:hypothetical protein